MKITERDKKLLIALGVVVFVVVFLKFLLLPRLNSISMLKAEIQSLNDSYAVNMNFKAKVQNLDSDIKILSKKLEDLREIYPPSMNSDELLLVLKGITEKSELQVKSIAFETPSPIGAQSGEAKKTENENGLQVQGKSESSSGGQESKNSQGAGVSNGMLNDILNYFYLWGLKSRGQSLEEANIADGKGFSVSVKLEAMGSNEQVKTFLEQIAKLKNKAYCETSSISKQTAESDNNSKQNLKLSVQIVFYGIMDKGAGEYYLLKNGKWVPKPAEGKENIFESYGGFSAMSQENGSETVSDTDNTGIGDGNNTEEDETILDTYDFSVVAAHFGDGLAPSVSIRCANPASPVAFSNPVVYGDSTNTENAEIFIEEKGGKYFCKFKTDHESYPDRQYSQTMEFVPSGKELKLEILSSERTDENDAAGLKLNIINNTDKDLVYEILKEDPESPRVQIGKTVGTVVKK
jgi:type IV pilus assembly protein PilO